jgi:hypothetical protein
MKTLSGFLNLHNKTSINTKVGKGVPKQSIPRLGPIRCY